MKKKTKKAMSMLFVVALVAIIGVAGMLAYLSSEDDDVNVMTMGNVNITQHEYERVVNADGTYKTDIIDGVTSYVLKDFTQEKPLYPFVGAVNNGYDSTEVRLAQLGHNSRGGMSMLPAANVQDKLVVVENTGESDAYVRTLVAFEAGSVAEEDWWKKISYTKHFTWDETQDWFVTEIDGNNYYVVEFVYKGYGNVQHPNGVLTPGDYTYNSLAQVYMFDTATNEDVEAIDGNDNGMFDILVLSQATQTNGFADAKTALDTAFGAFNATNVVEWFKGTEIPTGVATAAELTAALTAGKDVYLTEDVTADADTTMVIGAGTDAALDLNGHTLSVENTRTATHNFFIDVKGGTLTVSDGTVAMKHTGANMGWNGATTVIDVTAGGVLNLEKVTVKNEGGTDMNFGVHLNNWGEVTLNANNCVFDATYCGVRVFNSGYDMNNVTIKNSTLKGATRAFWVHNYLGDLNSAQHSDEAIKARLNLDIYGNGNNFELTGTATSPIRYGFGTTVFFDENGNKVN